MSDTAFTCGPWAWDGQELYAEGSFLVLSVGISGGGYPFVRLEEPDKALIAAAPLLYDALDEIINYCGGADNGLDDEYVVERALAALRSARGDQP